MDQNISLGEAFKYCASFTSYWIWIIVFVLLLIVGLFLIEKMATKANRNMNSVKLILVIICAFLIFGAIFKNPANVAQNTSKEQASRGVYIGF